MFCKNCGQYIDENSKFCKYCGTSQAIMASVGVINKVTGRSGVLEIPSNISVETFVGMLFAKGWLPNNAFTVSTLEIKPTKDDNYVIYDKDGENSANKSTILETLAEHDSDDVFIFYKEKYQRVDLYDDDDEFYRPRRPRPYGGGGVCLYGCPSSDRIECTYNVGDDENEQIESSIF